MSHALGTLRGRLIVSLVALAVLALVVGMAVFSAFSSTQASSTNTFTAGTVVLSANGSGQQLFNLPTMKPGDSATECVEVSYSGTLPAGVQLYGSEAGTLAPNLATTIVRGTFPGAAPSNFGCAGFTPDSGGGILFSNTLDQIPTSASPITDPGSWTNGSVHDYKITVTLPSNAPNSAQGEPASAAFTWQALSS